MAFSQAKPSGVILGNRSLRCFPVQSDDAGPLRTMFFSGGCLRRSAIRKYVLDVLRLRLPSRSNDPTRDRAPARASSGSCAGALPARRNSSLEKRCLRPRTHFLPKLVLGKGGLASSTTDKRSRSAAAYEQIVHGDHIRVCVLLKAICDGVLNRSRRHGDQPPASQQAPR